MNAVSFYDMPRQSFPRRYAVVLLRQFNLIRRRKSFFDFFF